MRTFPLTLAAVAAWFALGTAQARTVQQQVAADPRGQVDVSDVSGRIEIIGWDKPQVAVNADLDNDSQNLELRSTSGHTSIRITRGNSGWFGGGGGDVRLEVHVPRDSEVSASGVSSEIVSHAVVGAQRLQTVSGDIDAELGSGNNEAKTVSGTIHLKGAGSPGSLHVTSVSGEVRITNAAGDLEASTISGSLGAQLAVAHSVRLHTTSGEVELTAHLDRGATVETETVSGEQRIGASAAAGYQYEVRTFSGDIDDCFGQKAERTSEYAPGRRLDGTRGGGDGQIRIKSLSGDVSLCDH